MQVRRLFPLMVLLMLVAVGPGQAQVWQRIGPDSALPCSLAASPAQPNVMYAGFDHGGVFRSDDGGRSWSFAGAGIGHQSACILVVDPAQAARVYVLSAAGVLRSGDGGGSWLLSSAGLPVPAAFDSVASQASLVIAGSQPLSVYAAYPSGVFWSRDGGKTWSRRDRGLPSGVRRLAVDPLHPEVLYAATSTGFFKTVNAGRSWFEPRGAPQFDASDPFLGPDLAASAKSVFLTSMSDGVFRSRDGGSAWERLVAGLGSAAPSRLWIDHGTGRLFLLATVAEPYPEGFRWVTRTSDDDGSSWAPASPALTLVQAISAANAILYAATPRAVLRSQDGGQSWAAVSMGIAAGDSLALIADPTTSGALYTTGPGVWRSLDSGETWSRTVAGLGPYQTPSSLTLLPPPSGALVGGVAAGVVVSEDRGDHWTVHPGLACNDVQRVLATEEDPPVLYATGYAPDEGCVQMHPFSYCDTARTNDLGVTWSCVEVPSDASFIGLDPQTSALYARREPYGLERSLDGGGTYEPVSGARRARLVVFDPRQPAVAYAATDLGAARSADGGATWQRLNFPVATPVVALAFPPQAAATVYAATAGEVYRTRDGGSTWIALGSGLGEVTINGLLVNPSDPAVVYAATAGGGVIRLRQAD